jgi:hypothetical protein
MATIKQYSDFDPIDLTQSKVRTHHFFNDVEMLLLSNFVTFQEYKILMAINLQQKFKAKRSKYFRIPYQDIYEKTGLSKTLIRRHLSTLQQKGILQIVKPMEWNWNLLEIAKLLGPKPELVHKPVNERNIQKISSERVIFLSNPLEDPLLKGLPENWDKF